MGRSLHYVTKGQNLLLVTIPHPGRHSDSSRDMSEHNSNVPKASLLH